MKLQMNLTAACAAAFLAVSMSSARADAVTDWNTVAGDVMHQARMGTPPAVRAIAIVQTAVHEAVSSVQLLQPGDAAAATDAAIAAANRATLARLLPSQAQAVEAAYRAALGKIAEGPAKAAGIAAGEQAAARVLAWRAADGAGASDAYRPHTTAGAYVPTAAVATPQWPQRMPWLLQSAAQFRPAPPPALGSAQWARDFNEVKAVGSKASTQRTPEQTEAAKFWEYSLPPIYFGVVKSVAQAPGRTVAQNARLYAAAGQAMDDALIAVMDAKYAYGFWRPVTAIRNGDRDDNPATERDASWAPLIDNPGHPEYPSAHSILAGAVGELLKAETRSGRVPELATSSPSANGATRRWTSVDAFVQEVANARVWEGIHYRFSTEIGLAMGGQIGALAVTRVAQAPATSGVPHAIALKADSRLLESVAARGAQIYECRAEAAASGGAKWVFVAPDAELFDRGGARIGKHYAGPHWEAADGSKIVGEVAARADAPQADAIPWLLLSARRAADGDGRFAKVTAIQRVNTIGGSVPGKGCDASSVGKRELVPYTADYLLYGS
jgi:hypothetical protein